MPAGMGYKGMYPSRKEETVAAPHGNEGRDGNYGGVNTSPVNMRLREDAGNGAGESGVTSPQTK